MPKRSYECDAWVQDADRLGALQTLRESLEAAQVEWPAATAQGARGSRPRPVLLCVCVCMCVCVCVEPGRLRSSAAQR